MTALYSVLCVLVVVYVMSTQPQILGNDATIDLLDCTFCFHFLVSKETKETTKVGLIQVYMNFS